LPLEMSNRCVMLGSVAYTAANWYKDHTASTCKIRAKLLYQALC